MPYAKFCNREQPFESIEMVYEKYGIKIPTPVLPPKNLIILRGRLSNFKGIGCYAPLMDGAYITEEQREKQKKKLRSGAAAAMITGNSSATLAALGREDGNDKSNYVSALYITAKLNDTIQLKGWIGYFKFNEGDEVEVVAEKHPNHYEVYAIVRPEDQVISIVPPCSGGRKKTFKNAIIGHFVLSFLFASFFAYFVSAYSLEDLSIIFVTIFILFGIVGIYAYNSFKSSYVLLAERIFKTLGWQKPEYIDLWSMTKSHIKKLIEQGKYDDNWDPDRDIGTKIFASSSKTAIGIYYYDKERVYKSPKKNSNNKD